MRGIPLSFKLSTAIACKSVCCFLFKPLGFRAFSTIGSLMTLAFTKFVTLFIKIKMNMKLTFCRQLGLYHICQSIHCTDSRECEVTSSTPSFLVRSHLSTSYWEIRLPAPRLPAIVYLRLVFIYLYLN